MSAGSFFGDRLGLWGRVAVVTCLAYVAAGVAASAWQPDPSGLAFGGWLVILGMASGWYHLREWSIRALRADQAAMYGTFVALALHASTRHPWAWAIGAAAGILAGWRLALKPERTIVVGMVILQPVMILLGGLTAVLVLLEGARWMGVVAVVLFGVAWAAWQRPWGHGVWHVLTATAILLLFLGAR